MNERVPRTIGMALVVTLGLVASSYIRREFTGDDADLISVEHDYLQIDVPQTVPQISPETETLIYDEFITTVAFWKDQGVNLEDTRLVVLNTEDAVQCGPNVRSGAEDMLAFYCRPTDVVVFGEAFADMVTHIEPAGDRQKGVFNVVIAHELAHAVQESTLSEKSKLESGNIILKELQADCMAGQFMAGAPPARIDGAYDFYDFVVPVVDFTHGTQAQRAEAFTLGLQGEGCALADIRSVTL